MDVSNEDFSKYETVDIMGNRATPSNFNIFRDSLRANKQAMHQKMLENLPDMSLNDIDSDASGSDSEIVPLDFRTAMINNGTKLVIQARPKDYISVDQEMKAIEQGRFSEIDSKEDPDKANDVEKPENSNNPVGYGTLPQDKTAELAKEKKIPPPIALNNVIDSSTTNFVSTREPLKAK